MSVDIVKSEDGSLWEIRNREVTNPHTGEGWVMGEARTRREARSMAKRYLRVPTRHVVRKGASR